MIERHLAAIAIALALAAPAAADPFDRVGAAASHAWQSVTGFAPAHVNGLVLFAGRFGAGPYSGHLAIATVGPVDRTDRWRCAATVGDTRLYSTGFTETTAREKLLPYTNAAFHCERRDRSSLFD